MSNYRLTARRGWRDWLNNWTALRMRAKKDKTPPKKISLESFRAAAEGAYGNLTAIAKRLGVSRTTTYAFMQEDGKEGRALEEAKAAKALVDEARESFDDIAENMIQTRILDGDTHLLIFYARTRLKRRGYSEELKLNHDVQGGVLLVPGMMPAEDWSSQARRQQADLKAKELALASGKS